MTGLPAGAQGVVQRSRALPELAHRAFGRWSLVGTEPFLDPADMPWTALLERYYPAIRAEAEQVLRVRDALPNFQDIAPELLRLTDDDQWKTFGFVGYDVWVDATVVRAVLVPAVMQLLGDANWYLPRWLRWLPELRHEDAVPVATPVPRPAEEVPVLVARD